MSLCVFGWHELRGKTVSLTPKAHTVWSSSQPLFGQPEKKMQYVLIIVAICSFEGCGKWQGIMFDDMHQVPAMNLRKAWTSPGTINGLLEKFPIPLDFNLLSIDIDGTEWHLSDAQNCPHKAFNEIR